MKKERYYLVKQEREKENIDKSTWELGAFACKLQKNLTSWLQAVTKQFQPVAKNIQFCRQAVANLSTVTKLSPTVFSALPSTSATTSRSLERQSRLPRVYLTAASRKGTGLDRSQSLFYFVPQENIGISVNITVELAWQDRARQGSDSGPLKNRK